ncbi:MAG: rod shape-determining protein MreC [bacterium]|nr:rod shape-determining protein MreC [bacterium]
MPSLPTLASVLLLAALVVAVSIWRAQAGSLFWTIVAPLASLRNSFDATENAALRAELASTTAALADRTVLYRENLLLKAQFGRDATAHVVLASVLMRPPGTPYDTLIIDAGTGEGVTQGALVSAGGNAYIGTVSDVYTSTSRVTLFSAPGVTYNALVLLSAEAGKSIPISLVGEGAGSMSAQVPSATAVSEGDTVVVPGISTAFAGVVAHIERPAGESFETLYVHLPVDLFSLQFVEVRLSPQTGVTP